MRVAERNWQTNSGLGWIEERTLSFIGAGRAEPGITRPPCVWGLAGMASPRDRLAGVGDTEWRPCAGGKTSSLTSTERMPALHRKEPPAAVAIGEAMPDMAVRSLVDLLNESSLPALMPALFCPTERIGELDPAPVRPKRAAALRTGETERAS